jgi:molybdopterin molybdotransferase
MDGIAIAYRAFHAGRREFACVGTQPAGTPPGAIDNDTQCLRVMTGAVLPGGTDTVIPIERIELHDTEAAIKADAAVADGQFVHRQGSDRVRDAIVLQAGTRIGSPELAVLASVGQASVTVSQLPRIAVVSTGDELVGVEEPLAPHQIRSSNGRAIEAAIHLHHCGRVTRRRLRDEPDNLLAELEALHDSHGAMILSGGVSMGDFDFVPGALQHLGARLVFHRIEQKPGRPMWFGVSQAGKPIFALPGNPVSTLVCMARYVIPALCAAVGNPQQAEFAELGDTLTGGPSRFTWFVPVTLQTNREGRLIANPRMINTSGDFSTLAATHGIAEIGISDADRSHGAVVQVFRW